MKLYSHACGGFDCTIVVRDIHGCYVELQELCHLVNFGAQDALVTVADFLDRGPDSWKVADFFRDLPNAFSVLGNHERRVAGTIRGTSKPAWSQEQTLSLPDPVIQGDLPVSPGAGFLILRQTALFAFLTASAVAWVVASEAHVFNFAYG
jgi:hypothetical protein